MSSERLKDLKNRHLDNKTVLSSNMFGETVIVSKSVEDGGVQAREPISREDERQTIDMARVFRLPVSKEIRYVWSLLSVPQ